MDCRKKRLLSAESTAGEVGKGKKQGNKNARSE
jgi:hypothetical protein